MSLGAAVTLIMIGAGAVQCLVLASFAVARRRLPLKWLAANCLTAIGFSLACFLSASPWLPDRAIGFGGPLGYAAAALYFSTIVHFLDGKFERTPAVWEAVVHWCLIGMALLLWIPNLVFRTGELRTWECLWTTYSFPSTTPLIWFCGLVLAAGILLLVNALLECSLSFQLSGSFFALCAVSDVSTSLGLLEIPWVASLGTFVFLIAISLDEARKWAGEANQLTELKSNLEHRVAERSAELAASRDKLVQAERLADLGRLAASVGHEINNPLTYVLCNLDLLRRKHESDQLVDDAIEGTKRIASIVSELRDLSRANATDDQVVDLGETLQLAAKTLRHQVSAAKQIHLESGPGCYVMGSPNRLTQLMVNLLSNALSSLSDSEPGAVQATCEVKGSKVIAVVRDEGCGISKSVKERMYEPFITTKADGVGLGLAVCRTIVQEVGGEMRFTSEENEGTTFEITFPKCDADYVSQTKQRACAQPLTPQDQSRVLVIDDEPAVLVSFKRMLMNCDVSTTTDGAEALRLIANEEFDLIFCDIVMPGLSGIEIVNQAKKQRENSQAKFVLMSGGNPRLYPEVNGTSDAMFLQKPFSPSDVYAFFAT